MIYVTGIVATHYIANNYFTEEAVGNQSIISNKLENPGLLGDSAGIMNALFSALVLAGAVYTLNLQRAEIEDSQKNNSLEKFETKFYEMIRLHKQNVNEIIVDDLRGRTAIEKMFYYLSEVYQKVEKAVKDLENIKLDGEKQEIIRRERMLQYLSDTKNRLLFIHEISYGYFFYGEKYYVTRNKTDVRYDLNVDIISLLILQKTHRSLLTPRNSILGHYFRHLYQIIQLVANEKIIEEKDKSKYTKLIRAQLSDFEQALLYYNSLSVMGAKWITPLGKETIDQMCPIARFRLIKNIPYYIEYFGINPAELFKRERRIWKENGFDFFEIELTDTNA